MQAQPGSVWGDGMARAWQPGGQLGGGVWSKRGEAVAGPAGLQLQQGTWWIQIYSRGKVGLNAPVDWMELKKRAGSGGLTGSVWSYYAHTCRVGCSVVPNSWQSQGPQPARLLCSWVFPGKNTGVGCHFLFQGIFPTQRSNLCLPHLCHWQDSLPLGSPRWGGGCCHYSKWED